MKEEENKVVCQNWVYLARNLRAKDLIQYFIQAEILNLDDDETIRKHLTSKEQNHEFLRLICKKGVNAFSTLISALKSENDSHIAELLENGIEKVKMAKTGYRRSCPDQLNSCARCPHCCRKLVCPDCSGTYDEGFSASPSSLSSSYPTLQMHTFSRNPTEYSGPTKDDLTLSKTPYMRETTEGYQPLIFHDTIKQQDHQVQFGLDVPTVLFTDPSNEKHDTARDESASNDYANIPEQSYENVSPDEKRIVLQSPLELPDMERNPCAESNEHFKYYQRHLGNDKGWCPSVFKIEDVENALMENQAEVGQYLIWYEAAKFCKPFISIRSQGTIHHFRIENTTPTNTNKRMFYIDEKYEFQRLEALLEHVKSYGISLDKEFRPEAGLY